MKKILLGVSVLLVTGLFGQVDKKVLNWYNGKGPGMDTEKGYKKFLKKKKSTTVVVAVIDSGVDIEHEDLEGSIWKNEDEIPNNGKDDDNNGYIDDVYGWSFLGNKDGKDVNQENLEMVRIYRKLNTKFDGKLEGDIADEDKADWALFQEVSDKIEEEVKKYQNIQKNYGVLAKQILPMIETTLKNKFGEGYTLKDVEKKWEVEDGDAMGAQMKNLAIAYVSGELTQETIDDGLKQISQMLDYYYNVEFDARHIIGDNPADFSDVIYGCNRVEGPDAGHGTHVSGIICATRGNGIGNDGVADNVQIMTLRAVPNGDERDKDVALAIRYAVDNGAKIINMSFGKSYSQFPDEVYEAMKYASDNDVLLVHAAGNDHKDIDSEPNFPKANYAKGEIPLLMTIGASTRFSKADLASGDGLAASFTNYGIKSVDIFAPGHAIYSTTPDNEYQVQNGTSMAAPMVSGVAALIKSYYPDLTMKQIRDIMIETGVDYTDLDVVFPGKEELGKFGELSKNGKVVNVYNCLQKAEEMSK